VRAVGLRYAVAVLIAGSGIGLAVRPANAETAAPAQREALDRADSGVRDATSAAQKAERRRERRELRSQLGKERLAHAREVLFDGIELSAEQSRGVDAIIEAELKFGQHSGELSAELAAAREQGDRERIRAIGAESRDAREGLRGPHERMEEMRALLSEEQRPIFDMNRARLAAEGQEAQERRSRRRPNAVRAGAGVKFE
jgi:hypothetical protein